MKDWGNKPIRINSGQPVSMADAVRRVILNYPDTVQRAMRRHGRHVVKCISQNESLYKKMGQRL